jgi:hypothetical protein
MLTYHLYFIKVFYTDPHKTPSEISNQIHWAKNPGWSTIKDMGINHWSSSRLCDPKALG